MPPLVSSQISPVLTIPPLLLMVPPLLLNMIAPPFVYGCKPSRLPCRAERERPFQTYSPYREHLLSSCLGRSSRPSQLPAVLHPCTGWSRLPRAPCIRYRGYISHLVSPDASHCGVATGEGSSAHLSRACCQQQNTVSDCLTLSVGYGRRCHSIAAIGTRKSVHWPLHLLYFHHNRLWRNNGPSKWLVLMLRQTSGLLL